MRMKTDLVRFQQRGLLAWLLMMAVGISLWFTPAGFAQTEPPPTPDQPAGPQVHIVQEGETLFSIATLYGTTPEAFQLVNNINDPTLIFVGQELLIPGATGVPIVAAYTVQLGDTLADLAAAFDSSPAELAAANRLVHPQSLYAGQPLAVVSQNGSATPRPVTGTPHIVQPGDTLLSLAARYGLTLDEIRDANQLPLNAVLYPGMRLQLPGAAPYQSLTGEWAQVRLQRGVLAQGQTASLYVETVRSGQISGQLNDRPLRFTPFGEGYVALVGLDAFAEPGRYTLELQGTGDRPWWPFRQTIAVAATTYPASAITLPEEMSDLLDPTIRAAEDELLAMIYSQFTDRQYWEGLFQVPVSTTIITDGYGSARSYNGGPYDIFHSGVDFAGGLGTPVKAAANGVVVYSDFLTLRGITVVIDHGLGVMTGYYHLSQATVQAGTIVQAGQIIGAGGSTGLSTGPHLHWDLRILNVPVDGLQWTQEPFP
jgi:murein DD-endopeptidase MepM/ murein hydrolase activator NlpD